jgi:hypothetical protein
MLEVSEQQDPLLDEEKDTTVRDALHQDEKQPLHPVWDTCGKIVLTAVILGAANALGYALWLTFLEIGVEVFSGSSTMDLILDTPEIFVFVVVSSITLYFLFINSNLLHKLYVILKESGCCHCAMAALILYVMNALVFVLFVFIGVILEDEEEYFTYETKVNTAGHQYTIENTSSTRVRRDIREFGWAMAAIFVVNLGTIYFLCKRSENKARHIKALTAVFSCCRSKKEYKEATLPLSEVCQQIKRESCCSDLSLRSCLSAILSLVAGMTVFAMVWFEVGLDTGATVGTLLMILSIPAIALWFFVYNLISQGGFLLTDYEDKAQEILVVESCCELVAEGDKEQKLEMESPDAEI